MSKISARKNKNSLERICQGDIFCNIKVVEKIHVIKSELTLETIRFPYAVCLNQECDLENDYNECGSRKDSQMLHFTIAPAFNFDLFLEGKHWGELFKEKVPIKRKDTKTKLIIDNEIPRYHYLKFPESDMPELIIDFKHSYTVNRSELYDNISSKRLCSMDDLFREKISQRYSNYISRIGLPEV